MTPDKNGKVGKLEGQMQGLTKLMDTEFKNVHNRLTEIVGGLKARSRKDEKQDDKIQNNTISIARITMVGLVLVFLIPLLIEVVPLLLK